jgi:hypothetical protein
MKPGRVSAIAALLAFAWIALPTGCAEQGEGDRCDIRSGNADCDDGLECVEAESLLDTSTSRCCPSRAESTGACARGNATPGGGGGGGMSGAAGEGGAAGEAGAAGEGGAAGEAGAAGAAGVGGTAGDAGAAGVGGTAGDAGAAGVGGNAGAGESGSAGTSGTAGTGS